MLEAKQYELIVPDIKDSSYSVGIYSNGVLHGKYAQVSLGEFFWDIEKGLTDIDGPIWYRLLRNAKGTTIEWRTSHGKIPEHYSDTISSAYYALCDGKEYCLKYREILGSIPNEKVNKANFRISAINENDIATGTVLYGVNNKRPYNNHRIFIWDIKSGKVSFLDKGTQAKDINELNQVFGMSNNGLFVYENDKYRYLKNSQEFKKTMCILRFNNQGVFVGEDVCRQNIHSIFGTEAVSWENGECYYLRDLVINADGWDIYAANDINDYGFIACTAIDPKGVSRAVILKPIN